MRNHRRHDRGIALALTMMVVLGLLGLGATAVWLTSMGMRAAGSLNARQAAYNAASAGIEHARQVLTRYSGEPGTYCPGNTAAPWSCALAGKSHARDELQTTTAPKAIGAILHDGATPLAGLVYPYLSCSGDSDCGRGERCVSGRCSPELGSYTVWVRNDPFDVNQSTKTGGSMALDTNASVILRVEGRDAGNNAVVVLEAALSSASVPKAPASLTFGKNVDQFGSNAISGSIKF